MRGERRVATLTTAKTANTPTHRRLRTEHLWERLRTDFLAKRLSQGFRCWSERENGFHWLYQLPKRATRMGWDGMEQWLWAERKTSNRRTPSDSGRDVPSCVVVCPYPAFYYT